MPKQEFKFLEAYRSMAPTTNREVIEARQKSHDKLFSLVNNGMERAYDLCRFAFQLPYDPAALVDWFEKTVKEFDVQFSIALDKAEAGRIAALLLRDLIWRGTLHYSLAVLAVSYCGRRAPVGGNELLTAARDAIVEAGKERRVVLADKKIAFPTGKDLKAELDAIQASLAGPTVKAGMDAMAADLRDGAAKLATLSNDAFQSLKNDAVRMAEEIDMLWWHIGDWSDLLDKPRGSVPELAVAVVSGTELGGLVRQLPGPYGAYGILRRTAGKAADQKANIKMVIDAIDAADLKRMARTLPQSALTLFPIHAAINFASERGPGNWAQAFDQAVGDVQGFEVSIYELAIQTFRERVLLDFGGLGQ
jgi:hypothetical protein